MKKILLVLALVLVVGLSASFSYAEVPKVSDTEQTTNFGSRIDNEQREAWFQQRIEWKKAQLEKALTDGQNLRFGLIILKQWKNFTKRMVLCQVLAKVDMFGRMKMV